MLPPTPIKREIRIDASTGVGTRPGGLWVLAGDYRRTGATT